MWAISPPALTVSVALVAVTEEVTCAVAKLKLRRSIVSCAVIPATVPLKVDASSRSFRCWLRMSPCLRPNRRW